MPAKRNSGVVSQPAEDHGVERHLLQAMKVMGLSRQRADCSFDSEFAESMPCFSSCWSIWFGS